MSELFGVSMTVLAVICASITAGILGFVGFIALRNPVMFKTGLRNIPRRKAQTTLIVVGLMLSTVIVTAAFGTGDTMTASMTSQVYRSLGEADEEIRYNREDFAAAEDDRVIPLAQVDEWAARFADDPDIEGFLPLLHEVLPIANLDTRLNEARASIVAFRAGDAGAFGGLRDSRGKPVSLSGNQIAVNETLAGEIDAKVGDTLVVVYGNLQQPVKVVAIVPDTLLGGAVDLFGEQQGGAVDWEFLADLTEQRDAADTVFVTNRGDERSGRAHTDAAMARLEAAVAGTRFEVEPIKQDQVALAQFIGNIFTTFFVIFGLFSIAAGILLIFLIFTMLAAERKPEMGMARAVGARRQQIVESFLAEGLGYDLGSATVGLVAGMGVTFAMTWFVKTATSDEIGNFLDVHFTLRSLVMSFCLGVIATFVVIFFASWRASRLNIVAAIRDLPESQPLNAENATVAGYLRGTLNAMVAFGVLALSLVAAMRLSPLFWIVLLFGLLGPWLYVIRGHNLAAPKGERKAGERIPLWPLFTGLGTLLYPIVLLLVWVVRDRRPRSIPAWLVAAGVLVAPLGLVLAALQDQRRPIAWGAGFGAVALAVGALWIQWGLDVNQTFFFAGGVSLVVLGIAVTLRYFQIAERLTFTLTSAALLLFWYLAPSGKLDWIWGEMQGDFEMFFLSGMVMIAAGTFIVVYNADIVLPAVGALGGRFGRIFPALKTAIAYPLTSRFRTGMTVAMIGLIMFSLVMFATINTNFARIFLSDESKGGFDVVVAINDNNRIDGLAAALAAGGADSFPIVAAAELRHAWPTETEIEDSTPAINDDGSLDRYDTVTVNGADDTFLRTNDIKVEKLASGYGDSRGAWLALATDRSLAIIGTGLFGTDDDFGDTGDLIVLPPVEDGFAPFSLTFRDPASGLETRVTVIGVLDDSASMFFPGVFVHRETLMAAFPDSKAQTFFLKLRPGTDAEGYARLVEATLVQASSDSLGKLLEEERRTSQGFLYLFQGFMGLGLLVGIAALGVISFRAVVERRQQIGMLRAIGYQRAMVAISFMFESSFIALSGILLGLVLAVSLSWVLFTSGTIDESAAGAGFTVPWLQLAVICTVAFIASLVMTFIPAQAASRVPIAEALRYE